VKRAHRVPVRRSDGQVQSAPVMIQAGKEGDARAFAAETFGARRPDFAAHLARAGVTRETWTLQETPMGSLMLVWFEGDVRRRSPTSPLTTPST
jgi:hypothetical protein